MNTPAPASAAAVVRAAKPSPLAGFSRGSVLRWLRRIHIWIGLWGAALGLLFGASGILLNHRAMLKIPAAQTRESSVQLPLPQPVPNSAEEMSIWLQQELALEVPASRVREEPPRPVAWDDKTLQQPGRWQINFATPRSSVQAEYWVGSGTVAVKRGDSNVFAALNNLHKGTGMGIGWILLADTLAGSIILLSLSGVILWSQFSRRRLTGAVIAATSVGLTLLLIARAL